ncbi:hypothetical protein, partial [Salmonella sp. s57402]|uniref:hypothetical protein n=1 Tax=Salmonella sp. s57402 TaxID=3159695 RepID=UPI00397ECD02
MDKPEEIFEHQIVAFSYFFDKAAEVGLIDPYVGGSVTVRDFFLVANNTCFTMNSEQPFLCLDLTFISNLLLFGFGLTA